MIYPLAWFGIDNTMLVLVIGLLIFGRRLPEVGRSLGRGIVEFKKGLQGLEDDIDTAVKTPTPPPTINRQLPPATNGYRYDPFTGKPIQAEPAAPAARFDPYTGQPLGDQAVGADQGRSV